MSSNFKEFVIWVFAMTNFTYQLFIVVKLRDLSLHVKVTGNIKDK